MNTRKPTLMRPDTCDAPASYPVATPIQPSVVYSSETPDSLDAQYEGRTRGYTYSREGHPNADALAARLDRMEKAPCPGVALSSGMAAVSAAVLALCGRGDHVIASHQLYGRSLRFLADEAPRMGIAVDLVDVGDARMARAAIQPETRMILTEVVSNPTLRIADISGLARAARENDIVLCVDNTFTTPRAFQPFAHGADLVLHSVTKLLAGHSDAMLGYIAARNADHADRLRSFAITLGMTASPFDAWLAERGLLSFDLRFDRAQSTARTVAATLAEMPGVTRVLYPGRDDHPDGPRASELLGDQTCNMVSFEIDGGRAAANAFAAAADGLAFAPTLGDVGTTLSHPASSSHRALGPEQRAAMGISEGMFRLSIGLEDPGALIGVLGRAVSAARNA